MIRAQFEKQDGGRIVMLGLGPENMRRLAKGEPIMVNLCRLDPTKYDDGMPDIDVCVAVDDGTLTERILALGGKT